MPDSSSPSEECWLVGHARRSTGYDRHGNATWFCDKCGAGIRPAVPPLPPSPSQYLRLAMTFAAVGLVGAVALAVYLIRS